MAPLQRTRSFSEEFNLLDQDRDGHITKAELIISLKGKAPDVSPEAAEAWASGILRQYASDSRGGLVRAEFAAFMDKRQEELRAVFDELDVTGSGRISTADVEAGLQKVGVSHMQADVDRVLRRIGKQERSKLVRRRSVNAEGVSFDAFFETAAVLPEMSAHDMLLLGTASAVPMTAPPPGTTPAMIVAAGCINGAVSRTVTAPTDRLRAVLATGAYPDIVTAFRAIRSEQGLGGFWSSNMANVVQVAPENGIAFALNELLRDRCCVDPAHPRMAEKFLLGGMAGAVAMTAVYPMARASSPNQRGTPCAAQPFALATGDTLCHTALYQQQRSLRPAALYPQQRTLRRTALYPRAHSDSRPTSLRVSSSTWCRIARRPPGPASTAA